ncbi:hypothetical protein ACFL1H_06575 [Nanoarchaeota archaeon]
MGKDPRPKIENCPKKMYRCPEKNCPEYNDCWAYREYEQLLARQQKERNSGWE